MKKASRLIAILLTVCALFATACIFASAAETNQFDASNLGENIQNHSYATGGLNNSATVTRSDLMSSSKQTQDGNTYHRFRKLQSITSGGVTYDLTTAEGLTAYGAISSSMQYLNSCRGNKFSSAIDTALYSYTVFSMDFMSDAADENGKLLYADGSWLGMLLLNCSDYARANFVSDPQGNWYMSSDTTYSENDAPISGKVGEWNNLTFVVSGKSVHAFANGVYFGTKTVGKVPTVDRVVFSIWGSADIYTNYSVGIDQLSVYTYGSTANPYVTDGAAGLDGFIESGLYNSKSLSSLNDVIFNSKYSFGDDAAVSPLKGVVGGVEKNYHDLGALLDDVANYKNGDYIIAVYNLEALLEARSELEVIKGVGEGVNKYTFVSSAAFENENIFESVFTSHTKIAATGVVGRELNMTTKNGVQNYFMNTPYDGVAGNVNYNYYFTHPGYEDSNNLAHRDKYPTSANYKYATLDFEIYATEYSYIPDANGDGVIDENDGTVYSLAASLDGLSDCERATAKLAYYEGAKMASLASGWVGALYYVSDPDGNWYLSTEKSYSASAAAAPLSGNLGEKNHVTMLYDLLAKKIHAFVNGEFVASFTGQSQVERFAYIIIQSANYSPCHFSVSDVQVKYYKTAYESSDKVFGLDEYIAQDNFADYNISFVGDGSANAYYNNSSKNVKLTDTDGNTFYYTTVAAAFEVAKTGDTLYYDGALYLFDNINGAIETLNIVADSVTIVEGSSASFVHTFDAATGTLNRKSVYAINWYNENDEYITEYVSDTMLPSYETVTIDTSVKGDYNQINAWEWALEGEKVYAPLSTLTSPKVGDVYNVRPLIAPVEWIDGANSDNVIIEDWFVGSTAKGDFVDHEELEVFDNGWYELAYFWGNDEGEVVTDFTVPADGLILTSLIRPVSVFSLSNFKVNFTLGAQFSANFYVPVPGEEILSVKGKYAGNISCASPGSEDGYYDDLTECIAANKILDSKMSTVTIGGEQYYKFNATTFTSYAWYSAAGFEMVFTVDYEGEEYELSTQVAIVRLGDKSEAAKSLSYINTIMNKECGSKEKVLVLNWMRYINLCYRSQGSLIELSAATSYKKHYKCCGIDENLSAALPTAEPQHSAPTGVIATEKGYSASYYLGADFGSMQITVPKAFADEAGSKLTVYSTFVGMDNDAGKLTNVKYEFKKVADTSVKVDGVDCYYYRMERSAGVYNINAVQNICIAVDGEIVGSIEYSFAKYLYNTNVALGVYTLTDGAYVRKADAKVKNEYLLDNALGLSLFGEAAYNYKLVD